MIRAVLKNGDIFHGPRSFLDFKKWATANEGKMVTIALDKPERSNSQNSYYWLYLGVIEQETGQLATDVHEWAKRKFLPPRFIKVNGEEMKIPASTTELSKNDFTEYLDKISAAVEIALPNPEAAGYLPH